MQFQLFIDSLWLCYIYLSTYFNNTLIWALIASLHYCHFLCSALSGLLVIGRLYLHYKQLVSSIEIIIWYGWLYISKSPRGYPQSDNYTLPSSTFKHSKIKINIWALTMSLAAETTMRIGYNKSAVWPTFRPKRGSDRVAAVEGEIPCRTRESKIPSAIHTFANCDPLWSRPLPRQLVPSKVIHLICARA